MSRGSPPPQRSVVLGIAATAIAAVAALVIAAAIGSVTGSSPRASEPDDSQPTAVTVDARGAGRPLPNGFVGLSIEYPALERYAGTNPRAVDPVFEQLIRNLAPGQAPLLRIGGDSADSTWWPTPALHRPTGVTFSLTRRWLEVARALTDALNAHLVLGINLEADNTHLAAAEATALVHGLGRAHIRALELGNEPDLYADFTYYRTSSGRTVTGRPPGYDPAAFIDDFSHFASVLPRLPLAGPSLGGVGWTRRLGQFLVAVRRVGLVTLHRYPLQLCFTPRGSSRYPTLAHLLSPAASRGLADGFAPYVSVAAAHGLPLRIDELNTVSCGADTAVSNTFASALWALDTTFEMDRIGVHGINMHTFPSAGYDMFRLARIKGRWRAVIAPEYYGLMMFVRAAPPRSRLLRVTPGRLNGLDVWATRTPDGTMRVALINEGSGARTVSLGLPGGVRDALLERLLGPSARASSGVTLAGQSFAPLSTTGLLAGRLRVVPVPAARGRYTVRLPGISAALLVLPPNAGHR